MTKLSVNINKIATLRNSRGGNVPDPIKVAIDCERFGAEGITVHPRPDERHIRYADVLALKEVVTTEFNIEGYPEDKFIELVLKVKPTQVTLVPDAPGQLTSNHGWDTQKNLHMLRELNSEFKLQGIRSSIFVDPSPRMVEYAAKSGADRVELYTEPYALEYPIDPERAIKNYYDAAVVAKECELGLNAGHDLSLENLAFFKQIIPWCDEVSIGHALIADALYFGLEETIKRYKAALR
ncbi:MAG: pyridoxine 5'-phosphate synthase [Bacteroidales bacterium]